MSYTDLPPEVLEHHFNPRAAARGVDGKIGRMVARSAEVRARYRHRSDVPYGEGLAETADIFFPREPASAGGAPVQLFVHGGYWRAMDKRDYSFLAAPFVDAGAMAVVINYGLAPAVTLDEIVRKTVRSIAWTYRSIGAYGGDPERLYLSGNSAGGHLVAMALAHDWTGEGLPADLVKGAAAISGVMDLAPVLRISVNEDVRLDPGMAHRNSPIHCPPLHDVPLIIAVGGAEPAGWVEMSRAYLKVCEASGLHPRYLEMSGADHFDISVALGDAGSELTLAVLRQMGLGDASRNR